MSERLTDIRTPKGVVNNPFTLDSGRIPKTLVSGSTADIQEIIDVFSSDTPSYQSCFISGIQGSGKTVSLTFIAEHFQNSEFKRYLSEYVYDKVWENLSEGSISIK